MQKLRLAGTERGRKGNELHYCDTLAHIHKWTQNRQHTSLEMSAESVCTKIMLFNSFENYGYNFNHIIALIFYFNN